jgi:hypothetical protein
LVECLPTDLNVEIRIWAPTNVSLNSCFLKLLTNEEVSNYKYVSYVLGTLKHNFDSN